MYHFSLWGIFALNYVLGENMKDKTNKKIISAYMTIEVSLLFPLVLIILIIIIYISYYSYNQTIAFQNSAIVSLYGKSLCYTETDKDVLSVQMYETLETLNEGQYLGLNNMEQTVSFEDSKISIWQQGTMFIPIISMEIDSQILFEEGVTLNKLEPIFYIRQIRKVK